MAHENVRGVIVVKANIFEIQALRNVGLNGNEALMDKEAFIYV